MAARRRRDEQENERKLRPATTPEDHEQLMISRSMKLAARQIEEGNVSAQVLTHFLKLGTVREQLERERLRNENQLLQVKIESMASAKEVEVLYKNALNAMREYQGQEPAPYDDVED